MDAAQWSQQVVSSLGRPMEEVASTITPPNNNNPNNSRQQQEASLERRTRPQKDQILNCPRCHSTNTKFCYYNNYSLTQPRYFCKTCRRYWTQGGTLRSVPVGGGSRKNKRSLSSTSSTPPPLPPPLSTTTTTPPITSLSHLLTSSQNQNPNFNKFHDGQDLNLSFPIQGLFHHQLSKIEGNNNNINININNNESKSENYELPININGNISTNNSCTTTNNTTNDNNSTPFSALELLRSGIASRGSLNPFIPMSIPDSNTFYQSGYPNLQDYKPSMNLFSSPSHHQDNNNDNNNNNNSSNNENNNNNNDNNNTSARLLFPFADMNKLATNNTHQHHDDQIDIHDQSKGNSGNDHHQNLHSGYWSGMLGGGPW